MPLDPIEPPGKVFDNADCTAANVDNCTVKALLLSACTGRLDVIQNFVLGGVSVSGSLSVVKYLVEQGADVNAKNNGGATILAVAMLYGHTEVAAYLRSVGG